MLITQKQCIELYGDPGVHRDTFDPAWRKANTVTCYGPVHMPGVPDIFYFECHRKAEARIRLGFEAAKEACPEYRIKRAASWVFRRQRWDTIEKARYEGRDPLPLSLHSWGVAVDVDAATNRAIEFHDGGPAPFSPEWRRIWPDGLPEKWVRAFCEAAKADWGGDWHGYRDPQHLQLKAP